MCSTRASRSLLEILATLVFIARPSAPPPAAPPHLALWLEVECPLWALPLRVAPLDRLDHATHLLDLAEVALEALLHATREGLQVVRARERVDRVGDAGLVRDDLLGAQREGHGF